MTQATSVLPASVAACALRVARLAADGTTPAGATNGYVTNNFATLTFAREVRAGKDIQQENACGDLAVNYRTRDSVTRWNHTLSLLSPDPELAELMTAATLLTVNLATTRTVADATITNGSPTVTSPTAAFVQADVGSVASGTGITVGTRILSVQSPTSATLSANATATTVGTLSLTLTTAAISVGNEGPALGVTPADNGVSVELFIRNVRGGLADPLFPWRKVVLPASFWTVGDAPDAQNGPMGEVFIGYSVENPQWGNGPWNDWKKVRTTDAAVSLVSGRPMSWHYLDTLPTPAVGYATVPVQV